MEKSFPAQSELKYEYSVPFGYVFRMKFITDKKVNQIEILTKDQRLFKYRFDSFIQFERAITAVQRHASVTAEKQFFAFDYAIAVGPKIEFSGEIVLKGAIDEFTRMGLD